VEQLGGIVQKCVFVIELDALKGRDLLAGREVESLITFS
jgi:adenine/guanine phosphoribosyltransferase-like PRPP-binding protein